jgi:hypothetical protein
MTACTAELDFEFDFNPKSDHQAPKLFTPAAGCFSSGAPCAVIFAMIVGGCCQRVGAGSYKEFDSSGEGVEDVWVPPALS